MKKIFTEILAQYFYKGNPVGRASAQPETGGCSRESPTDADQRCCPLSWVPNGSLCQVHRRSSGVQLTPAKQSYPNSCKTLVISEPPFLSWQMRVVKFAVRMK